VLEAALFDWGETLVHFEWDDGLLAAGHRAGLGALGRAGEADAFNERFVRETLPALREPGAASRLDYGDALRGLLGPLGDDDLDRYLDAEHDAWRPARTLAPGAHALLAGLRDRGLALAVVANSWPEPARLVRRELDELGVTTLVDAVVLSGEVGARKPEPAIFECALARLGVDATAALFVGDRLDDDVAGAAAVGMTTAQALWFRADETPAEVEPDFLAFTPLDVLDAVRGFESPPPGGAGAARGRAADG
jgi:HAD superfamily hydrolase (TIGR01509 family)